MKEGRLELSGSGPTRPRLTTLKNFPHQVSNLQKLRAALSVFGIADAAGSDLDDDAVIGGAMARAGVYTFRNKALSVRQALVQERRKTSSRQGTRTVARDLRRFFALAGLLERGTTGKLAVASLGRHLLSLEPGSEAANHAWREALGRIALPEGNRISHPYLALLRLIAALPGIEARRLALALEAQDDTEREFARILGLARVGAWTSVLRALRVSKHMARNAIKILPAIAKQLGDVHEENGCYYPVAQDPAVRARRRRRRPQARRVVSRHRTVTPATIATSPSRSDRSLKEEEYADPEVSAELRRDRLVRHQALVHQFGSLVAAQQYELHEDPYDLLATHPQRLSILAEAKTLDGSPADENAQVRAAIGQLFYYKGFDVPPAMRENGLLVVAVFEGRPSEEHIAFLESLEVVTTWRAGDAFDAAPWSRERLGMIGLP